MKILIDAYFNQNLGDDAFIDILCRRYPGVDFYTWSDYSLNLPNLNTRFNRLENRFLSKEQRSKLHFRDVDGIIRIGGSLFMEGISEPFDFRKLKKPFFLLGANFGPYKSSDYLKEHQVLFDRAEDICFRDHHSQVLFPGTRKAADLIFNYPLEPVTYDQKKKQVFISVMNRKEPYISLITSLAESFLKQEYELVFAGFCKNEGDEKAMDVFRERFPQARFILYTPEKLEEMIKEINQSRYVIGTRLHSILLGLYAQSRVIPIVYNLKTTNQLEEFGFSSWLKENQEPGTIQEIPVLQLEKEQIEKLQNSAESQFLETDKFLKR